LSNRAVVAALSALVATAAPRLAAQPLGGDHSLRAPLASRSLLLDAAAAAGRVVAVGERGHVLWSEDAGATWTQADVPTRAMLTGVVMLDDGLAWAVGHDETILRSRDSGSTWEQVHAAPENERPLLDVWFRDSENGFAIGAYGAFLVTGDGGATWAERPIGDDDFHLNHLAAAADGTLYIAAEAGHLYRSEDQGSSWVALPSPYDGSFFGTLPLGERELLAFGLRGNLYRSADRGESWTPIPTGTEATLFAAADSGGELYVVGLAGVILRSTDGGRSFELETHEDRLGNVALLLRGDRILLFGEGGARPLEVEP